MARVAKTWDSKGGRKKGVPNKATVERALIAERRLTRAREQGIPLAKDVLERFMLAFAAMAQRVQPGTMDAPNPEMDKDEFERWGRLTVDTAKALAPFQSPTFRAIVVSPPPETGKITRITLTIFDDTGREVQQTNGKQIEGTVMP